MHSDEIQIRELVTNWQAATQAGDIDTVLGLMTEDVVFLIPGRPPMDKAEFAAVSRIPPGSTAPVIRGTSTVKEVQVSGDLAFIWTELAVVVTPPGVVVPIERAGHTLTVFRRIAGKWLLARDANLLAPVQRGLDDTQPSVQADTLARTIQTHSSQG